MMATSVNQFRARIFPHVKGCPYPKIDEAVIDAVIQFCEDTTILRKGLWVANASASAVTDPFPFSLAEFYGQSSNANNGMITVDLTDHFTGLDPIRITNFKPENCSAYNIHQTFMVGPYRKRYVFHFTSNTEMILFPFDTGTTHSFFCQLALKNRKGDTSVDDILYRDWEPAIRFKAISILQAIPNEEWTNRQESLDNDMRYRGEMGKAKLRVSSSYAMGSDHIGGGYF